MKKVAVCAGHGGSNSTPGKRTPAGEYEWAFNDKVIRAGIAVLKAAGVEVLRMDDATGKTDVGLTARTNKANARGADVYWSAHHNAMSGKWGDHGGIETFTQTGSHPDAEKLARIVHPKYVKAMGLRDRGVKKANLAITRQTKMPAILTEGGFMDSRIDIVKMHDDAYLKAQGEAIAEGILKYLGVNKVHTPAPQVKSEIISKPSASISLPNAVYRASKPYPKGSGVTAVQNGLSALHFYPDKGAKNNGVDGVYGPKTADAVKRFQSVYLPGEVDGVYGPNTKRAMERQLSK